jgi:hypothetical protein
MGCQLFLYHIKNKIIDKAAKSFGVERVKRHKYPKKG